MDSGRIPYTRPLECAQKVLSVRGESRAMCLLFFFVRSDAVRLLCASATLRGVMAVYVSCINYDTDDS